MRRNLSYERIHTHKNNNVSVLLYHLVFPAKYRRAVFDTEVDNVLREVCLEIGDRYQISHWVESESLIGLEYTDYTKACAESES